MTFHGSLFNVRVSYSMRCLYSVWPVLKCLPNSVSPSSCSTQSFPVIFFYSVVIFFVPSYGFCPMHTQLRIGPKTKENYMQNSGVLFCSFMFFFCTAPFSPFLPYNFQPELWYLPPQPSESLAFWVPSPCTILCRVPAERKLV